MIQKKTEIPDHRDAPGIPDTPLKRGFAVCPCPKIRCENHGHCLPCTAKHGRKNGLPRCER